MQQAVSSALQAILADRGYKVLEITTFSGAKSMHTARNVITRYEK